MSERELTKIEASALSATRRGVADISAIDPTIVDDMVASGLIEDGEDRQYRVLTDVGLDAYARFKGVKSYERLSELEELENEAIGSDWESPVTAYTHRTVARILRDHEERITAIERRQAAQEPQP